MSFNKDFLEMYSPVLDPCFCTSQNKKRTVGNFSTPNILVDSKFGIKGPSKFRKVQNCAITLIVFQFETKRIVPC